MWNEQHQANISSMWAQATQASTSNSNAVLHSTTTHTEHTTVPQQLQKSINLASTSPGNKEKETAQSTRRNSTKHTASHITYEHAPTQINSTKVPILRLQ
ncbi:16079_t:CDS:1 [Gigaspora rosea]|nr:16079_t:CDS:1 [Gigaspora rosea]